MAKSAKNYDTIAEALRAVKRSTAGNKQMRAKHAVEVAARAPGEGYEPCIVSYIDVLGFRNLLETRHAYEIRDALLQLREFTTPPDEGPIGGVQDARLLSRAFADSVSDAVVRVRVYDTQFSDGAFFHELLDLLHAQVDCLGHGVVIRAGVAIGGAHVGLDGKGPIFGPAMVRAYELEAFEAIYPRIIVDAAAYQIFLKDVRLRKQGHDLEEELQYVDRLLRVDTDGNRFIDYLRASEPEFDDPAGYFTFLKSHAELVRGKLASTTGRVREKFEWLAAYHNSVVDELMTRFINSPRSVDAFLEEFGLDAPTFLRGMVVFY